MQRGGRLLLPEGSADESRLSMRAPFRGSWFRETREPLSSRPNLAKRSEEGTRCLTLFVHIASLGHRQILLSETDVITLKVRCVSRVSDAQIRQGVVRTTRWNRSFHFACNGQLSVVRGPT